MNAGRLAEPLLKEGKQPKDDENCHKALLLFAEWLEYNGKYMTPTQQVKTFIKEQKQK